MPPKAPVAKSVAKPAKAQVVQHQKPTKAGKNADKHADPRNEIVEHAPVIITTSRTGIVKVPSVLMDAAFIELSKSIDKVVKTTGISTSSLTGSGFVKNAISTGCLQFDFVNGGGIAPGRFTVIPGREGSGKSTLTNLLAATCVMQGTPIFWFDAEGALSPDYSGKIFSKLGLKFSELFGVEDAKGHLVIPPIIRYSPDSIGEPIFQTMELIMKLLPTIKQGSDGTYWRLLVSANGAKKWEEDPREGKAQYLFLGDSLPAMLPQMISDDSDKNPMAVQARMFSNCLKTVKSLFTMKNCAFVATNQLRLNPMAGKSDPVFEPCGEAVKFYSDNRTRIMRISPNTAGVPSGSGAKFSVEPGLNGGKDQYVYSKIQNVKNKMFAPFRESTLRIRFLKDDAPGDGICETWDCASYLQATGQMIQYGKTLTMNVMPAKANGRDNGIFTPGQRLNQQQFKQLVEDSKYKRAVYMHCLRQMRSGYGFELERDASKRLIASAASKSKCSDGLDDPGDDGVEA
jgi:RecA/RadA recombinase